jgi:hypothetical protein
MGEHKDKDKAHTRRFSLDALKSTLGGGKKKKSKRKGGPNSTRPGSAKGEKAFDLGSYDASKEKVPDTFLSRDYNVDEIKAYTVR